MASKTVFSTLLACSALITAAPAQTTIVDDSAWINAGIATALRNGKKEYVLPSGTINLRRSIYIPAGAANFTLRGSASGNTILRAPLDRLSCMISAGTPIATGNNGGLTNQPTLSVDDAAEGDQTITVKPGLNPAVGSTFVLTDPYWQPYPNNGSIGFRTHAEITRVTAFDPTTRKATLDRPVGREYRTPTLINANALVAKNVTIRDLQMDGANITANTGVLSFVQASMVDGLQLLNIRGTHFAGWGIAITNSRDVAISRVNISDALAWNLGEGYGICATRSRFVKVTDCSVVAARHGFVAHCGTMDMEMIRCKSNGSNFDTHGMGEKRIRLESCESDSGFAIANEGWWDGATDITVENSNIGQLRLNYGTKNVLIKNTSMRTIFASGGGLRNNTPGADNVLFENCRVEGVSSLIQVYGSAGTISFVGCSFRNNWWGSVMEVGNFEATLQFTDCDFLNASPRNWDPAIKVAAPSPRMAINVRDCRFASLFGQMNAVQLVASSLAKVDLTGNRFFSVKRNSPVFVLNLGRGILTSTGNTATTVTALPTWPQP